MKNLTLIIPAKNEEISLPRVLEEIKNYKCKKIIILSKKDKKTFDAISNFKCQIIKQKIDGYGAALIEGIHNVKTKYLCIEIILSKYKNFVQNIQMQNTLQFRSIPHLV